MKTTISTLAILAFLTTSVMAQRGYAPGYGPGQNRYPAPAVVNPHADDAYDAYKLEQIDQIVSLSRQQKKEMKRIEKSYDQLATTTASRRNPQAFIQQKQQALFAVLTPAQRNTLLAYQQQVRRGGLYGRRG